MKGQSAIEYLTTYGWMILAVAVVSGVAYSNINNSCTRSSSDFYSDAIKINDFGLNGSGSLLLSLENSRYQELQFKSINVTLKSSTLSKNLDFNLSASEEGQVSIPGFKRTSGCNTMDIRIKFDRGDLQDQEVTGLIRAPIGPDN